VTRFENNYYLARHGGAHDANGGVQLRLGALIHRPSMSKQKVMNNEYREAVRRRLIKRINYKQIRNLNDGTGPQERCCAALEIITAR
jgi:hypothetical protein